jgi:diamine N-acetyltransferase
MSASLPVPKIVRATEAHLPEIARLAGEIWRAHYPGIISTAQIDYMLGKMYSLATLSDEITHGAVCYERLLVAGELAGFAAHGPTGEPKVFKLHKIYLRLAQHGQGLGTLLLRHCERDVIKLGARRLMLTVNKRNAKAIAAYERNGFVVTNSVVVDIGCGFVMDDYVMTKDLATDSGP